MSENGDQPQEPSTPHRFPKSYFMEKPATIGNEPEMSISELSRRGNGLARVQGYEIFVPNTKQGDNVKVKITQMRSNYAIGSLVT